MDLLQYATIYYYNNNNNNNNNNNTQGKQAKQDRLKANKEENIIIIIIINIYQLYKDRKKQDTKKGYRLFTISQTQNAK